MVNALVRTPRPVNVGTVPPVNSLAVGSFDAAGAHNALIRSGRAAQQARLTGLKIDAAEAAEAEQVMNDFVAATFSATNEAEFEAGKADFARRRGIAPGKLAQVRFSDLPALKREVEGASNILKAQRQLAQTQAEQRNALARTPKFTTAGDGRTLNRFTGVISDGSAQGGTGQRRPPTVPGFKPPTGFRIRLDDQGQPIANEFGQPEVEPIPGGPQTRLPAETAGRLAFAKEGLAQIDTVRKFFTDGKFNATARLQKVIGVGEIGRLDRDIGIAIEAALRAATGAAAPETEFQRFKNFFAPSADDTVKTALNKLARLRRLTARIAEDISRGRGGPGGDVQRILDDLAREFKVPPAADGGASIGQPGAPISGTPAISAPTPSLGVAAPGAAATSPSDGRSLAFTGQGAQGRTSTGVPFRIR